MRVPVAREPTDPGERGQRDCAGALPGRASLRRSERPVFRGAVDPTDLAFTSALEQAEMLERREVTSTELVECYLARIEALNPRLNSYITVAADHARAAAADADARRAAGAGTRRCGNRRCA